MVARDVWALLLHSQAPAPGTHGRCRDVGHHVGGDSGAPSEIIRKPLNYFFFPKSRQELSSGFQRLKASEIMICCFQKGGFP